MPKHLDALTGINKYRALREYRQKLGGKRILNKTKILGKRLTKTGLENTKLNRWKTYRGNGKPLKKTTSNKNIFFGRNPLKKVCSSGDYYFDNKKGKK